MEDDEQDEELMINEGSENAEAKIATTLVSPRAALLNKLKNSKKRLDEKLEDTATSTPSKTPSAPLDTKPLTYEETCNVNDLIAGLPSQKLAKIIVMIQTRSPDAIKQTDDEIEIDLDGVGPLTLRIIERFVTSDDLSSLFGTPGAEGDAGRGKRKKKQTERAKEGDITPGEKTPKKKRSKTSSTPKLKIGKKAADVLKKWAKEHKDVPFPSTEEKEVLATEAGISGSDIMTWFMNRKSKKDKPKSRVDKIEQMAEEAALQALKFPSGVTSSDAQVDDSDMTVKSVTTAGPSDSNNDSEDRPAL
jgi:hypothetical protein